MKRKGAETGHCKKSGNKTRGERLLCFEDGIVL